MTRNLFSNKRSPNASRRSIAFTLIELLVVIAIIGLLAAMLFPVTMRVRAKARQSTCVSNLKQLSIAMMSYAQDNDECLPFLAYNNAHHLGTDWQTATQSYTKSSDIWQCPDATEYAKQGTYCRSFGLPYMISPSGYSYNETAAASTTPGQIDPDGPTNGKTFTPAHLAQCGHPAQTFLFMDKGYGGLFTPWTQWISRVQLACQDLDKTASGPHNGGKNIAFVDGHVKWLKTKAILTQDQHSASEVDKDPKSPYFVYFAN